MCFCVFFSIYVMFLLYVYMFTICSCHVVLKVYLLTNLLRSVTDAVERGSSYPKLSFDNVLARVCVFIYNTHNTHIIFNWKYDFWFLLCCLVPVTKMPDSLYSATASWSYTAICLFVCSKHNMHNTQLQREQDSKADRMRLLLTSISYVIEKCFCHFKTFCWRSAACSLSALIKHNTAFQLTV